MKEKLIERYKKLIVEYFEFPSNLQGKRECYAKMAECGSILIEVLGMTKQEISDIYDEVKSEYYKADEEEINKPHIASGNYLNYYSEALNIDIFIIANEPNESERIQEVWDYIENVRIDKMDEKELINELEVILPYGVQILKRDEISSLYRYYV